MSRLRWLFVTVPCALFDAWWVGYRVLLFSAIMVLVTVTLLSLALELTTGIRWGW